MERDQETQSQLAWEDAIQIVQKELEREFRDSRSLEAIRAVARESVTAFEAEGVRIRTFVPVLAGRVARRRLLEGA